MYLKVQELLFHRPYREVRVHQRVLSLQLFHVDLMVQVIRLLPAVQPLQVVLSVPVVQKVLVDQVFQVVRQFQLHLLHLNIYGNSFEQNILFFRIIYRLNVKSKQKFLTLRARLSRWSWWSRFSSLPCRTRWS